MFTLHHLIHCRMVSAELMLSLTCTKWCYKKLYIFYIIFFTVMYCWQYNTLHKIFVFDKLQEMSLKKTRKNWIYLKQMAYVNHIDMMNLWADFVHLFTSAVVTFRKNTELVWQTFSAFTLPLSLSYGDMSVFLISWKCKLNSSKSHQFNHKI